MKSATIRPILQTLALGTALFAYGLAARLTAGVNKTDESWFLLVVQRVVSGETLYRDVFFGATPLSVYLATLPVVLFGGEILVIKALFALSFAATILVGRHIAYQLGLNRAYFTLAMLLYFVWTPGSLYSELATLGLMVSFSLALRLANRQGSDHHWAFYGALGCVAGLTFADKQNVGVYIAAALGVSVVAVVGVRQPVKVLKIGSVVLLTFTITVSLLLLPVLFNNSLGQFWDYGFANKSTYLETAGVSYFGQITTLLNYLVQPSPNSILQFQVNFLYVVALVTMVGLLIVVLRHRQNQTSLIVLLFAGTAVFSEYPRFDYLHFHNTAPAILLAAAYLWQQLVHGRSQPVQRLGQGAALFWLVIGVTIFVCLRVNAVLSGSLVISDLPHFRSVLITQQDAATVTQQKSDLLQLANHGPVLLVFPEASFYYLVTGLKNPTPFDFPLVSAFGQHGEAQVVDELSTQAIRTVCFRRAGGPLSPAQLDEFITQKMLPGRSAGVCTEYQLKPVP